MEIEQGNWYYLNKRGERLNEVPFEMAGEFKHGLAIIKQHGKWGVIDTAMNLIIPIEYNRIKRITQQEKSFFEVNENVSKNYIHHKSTGNLTSSEIRNLKNYSNGCWFAQKEGSQKWALIDTNLSPITAFDFDRVFPFNNGYATVIIKTKKTLINLEGQTIIPFYKCKQIEA